MATVKKLKTAPTPDKELVHFRAVRLPEHYRIKETMNIPVTLPEGGKVLIKVVNSEESKPEGWFWIPPFGKDRGKFYLCHVFEDEHWSKITIYVPTFNRSLNRQEVIYLRDVFFQLPAKVMQFVPEPNDYVKALNKNTGVIATVLWCSIDPFPVPIGFLTT